jgi:hypothetical protein
MFLPKRLHLIQPRSQLPLDKRIFLGNIWQKYGADKVAITLTNPSTDSDNTVLSSEKENFAHMEPQVVFH